MPEPTDTQHKLPPVLADLLSRRLFLGALGSAAVATVALPNAPSGLMARRNQGEQLDEALAMLAPYGPSYRGGLSNHGPMAAEALMALGQPDAVVPWVTRYRKRLEKADKPSAAKLRIQATNWQESLGKHARHPDWHAFFGNELAEHSWRDVLATWVPRLAPGLAAAGLHGVIRAGHAVCSLNTQQNASRTDELARALAYWASEYLLLPGTAKQPGKLGPADALRKVELLPREQRRTRGLITSELGDLKDFTSFPGVIDLVDGKQGTPDFLAELFATFSGAYAHTRRNSFGFLHAVTGTGAVAELLPHVKPEDQQHVLAYTWQATAAVYARFGSEGLLKAIDTKSQNAAQQASEKQLVERAAASGDEHSIKLVAACQRELRRHTDPRVLAAAARRVGL